MELCSENDCKWKLSIARFDYRRNFMPWCFLATCDVDKKMSSPWQLDHPTQVGPNLEKSQWRFDPHVSLGWRLPGLPGLPTEFHAGLLLCCSPDFCKLRAYKTLRLPASHGMFALTQDSAKSHFEACLQDVLRNLQCLQDFERTPR